MENIFLINKFENGWEPDDMYNDIFAQEEYCIEMLEIPDEKIYGTEMIANGMLEIVLTGVNKNEMKEDWYVNLSRLSI